MIRKNIPNPAESVISGTVDIGSTWYEDISLTVNGDPLTGVSDHVWTLELYKEPGNSADLTLTTADSTLTITEATGATTLAIRCSYDRLSGLSIGDYYCDIKSEDASPTVDGSSRIYLRGRGVVAVVEGAT